ncbi:hypothetical protein Efla_005546 [Eimeria flavescens]
MSEHRGGARWPQFTATAHERSEDRVWYDEVDLALPDACTLICCLLLGSLRAHPTPPLAGGPSRGEVSSFFRFVEAFGALQQQQQQQQQQQMPQQRPIPISAAVDAALFLAGCAVSSQWGLSITRVNGQPLLASGQQEKPKSVGGLQQQPQAHGEWLLLCSPSGPAAQAEALPLEAVTSLFTSLHHLLPKLPRSALTRLLQPLFVLGRALGVAAAAPLPPLEEVRSAAAALLQLLQAVLRRAAAEAPLLAAAETAQRVSAVAEALMDWSGRGVVRPEGRPFFSLLQLAAASNRRPLDRRGPWLEGRPAGEPAAADAGAAALATALQKGGAPALPHELLRAAADMLEASARAAAHGLDGLGRLQQHELPAVEVPAGAPQQGVQGRHPLRQQSGAAGLLRKPADAVRQMVATSAAWLPVYYLLVQINGGIWLPAVQQLAQAAGSHTARLVELFLAHQLQRQQQQQQESCSELEAAAEEAQSHTWSALGRLLYGETQQLTASVARIHALKPLRGMRRFAAAAVAFDAFLARQLSAAESNGLAGSVPCSPAAASLLRPLLHMREPPKDVREAERRIRFFCSLAALGSRDRSITAGVAACLPSEKQLHALSPLAPVSEQQGQRQRGRLRSLNGEAVALKCARQVPLQLLQRLLVCSSWMEDTALVSRGLAVLKLRLESLTLLHIVGSTRATTPPSSTSGHAYTAAGAAAGRQAGTAELVGKTLALLAKSASRLSHEHARGGQGMSSRLDSPSYSSSSGAPGASDLPMKEAPDKLRAALSALAAAATLWAAVTEFEKQNPEDVALLTFSLIPFWLQQDPAGTASLIHTTHHVEHIRAAAAAAAKLRKRRQQQQQTEEAEQQGQFTEQQLTDLAKSLRGVSAMFGVTAPGIISSAAVQFYLSKLAEKKGSELASWPSPLLFLLGYNVLRLRLSSKGPDFGRALQQSGQGGEAKGGAAGAPPPAAATAARQQQLSKAAESAAAQLLLRVVAAMEAGVTFPEEVDAWCSQRAASNSPTATCPSRSADRLTNKQQPARNKGPPPNDAMNYQQAAKQEQPPAGAAGAAGGSDAAAAGRRCNIRLVGLREVGSFLWALNRAEGGQGLSSADGSAERIASTLELETPFDVGSLSGHPTGRLVASFDERPHNSPSLPEAARAAAQAVKRPGGLADKVAIYCEAVMREANARLLERPGGPAAASASRNLSNGEGCTQQGTIPAGAAHSEEAKAQGPCGLNPVEALKAFCREKPNDRKPAVVLRPMDLPPASWVSTAGVSLGLLLSFFSSCRSDIRLHVQSAVLQAPLLAAECGLLQLFHLLRPLAAAARSELDSAGRDALKASSSVSAEAAAAAARDQTQPPAAAGWQSQAGRGADSSSSSGCLSMIRKAQAFVFAVAAGLLRHAQAIASLPPETPRTAAQVQLLLLAASDFAVLLHAHCQPPDGPPAAQALPASGASRAVVTGAAGFRYVLQELLSLLSNIALRNSKQICSSLALLAATAEVFSGCGRCGPLPPGSRKAMQAFAPAAIAALRQPASPQLSWKSPPSQEGGLQKIGGGDELRRLAAALEALKFVELK